MEFDVRMQEKNRKGMQQGLVSRVGVVVLGSRAQCLEFEDAGFSFVEYCSRA